MVLNALSIIYFPFPVSTEKGRGRDVFYFAFDRETLTTKKNLPYNKFYTTLDHFHRAYPLSTKYILTVITFWLKDK